MSVMWPLQPRMHGMPPSFSEELHDLIADWLARGAVDLDEIEEDLEYALSCAIQVRKSSSSTSQQGE